MIFRHVLHKHTYKRLLSLYPGYEVLNSITTFRRTWLLDDFLHILWYGYFSWLQSPSLLFVPPSSLNDICTFFSNHDDRDVCVSRNNGWHDWSIDYSKSFDSLDPEFFVNTWTHSTCWCWVINCCGVRSCHAFEIPVKRKKVINTEAKWRIKWLTCLNKVYTSRTQTIWPASVEAWTFWRVWTSPSPQRYDSRRQVF